VQRSLPRRHLEREHVDRADGDHDADDDGDGDVDDAVVDEDHPALVRGGTRGTQMKRIPLLRHHRLRILVAAAVVVVVVVGFSIGLVFPRRHR